jgi:hypothetical protein
MCAKSEGMMEVMTYPGWFLRNYYLINIPLAIASYSMPKIRV